MRRLYRAVMALTGVWVRAAETARSAAACRRILTDAARRGRWDVWRLAARRPLFLLALAAVMRAGYAPSLLVVYDPATPADEARRRLDLIAAHAARRVAEADAEIAALERRGRR